MIRHTVAFRLRHPKGSPKEREFLQATCALATIPVVRAFECLRQVSSKNDFDFGLSMEFETAEDYRAYNEHLEHQRFVAARWNTEVAEFMEIDYEPLAVGVVAGERALS
jgi:Stress responsive A/B Barrel Domain